MYNCGLWALFCLLPSVLSTSLLSTIEEALDIENITIPELNISPSNTNALQILGNIDTFSFFENSGQQNFTQPITNTTNSNGLIFESQDTFIQLLNGSEDTQIDLIIPITDDSFVLSGSGSLQGFELQRQLVFNLSILELFPIFESPLNEVQSILVNESLVYFGGNFTLTKGEETGHSIAVWDMIDNVTDLLPFGGFGINSTVSSILSLNTDQLLLAGEFFTLDKPDLLSITTNITNLTAELSLDITIFELEQEIPLRIATFNTPGGTIDPPSFICSNRTDESWFHPGPTGTLTSSFPFLLFPTKIRIYNSPEVNDEISIFQLISSPSESIMNLTFLDPFSGNLEFCDEFCPLFTRESLNIAAENISSPLDMITFLNNNTTDLKWSTTFQEFAFVNQVGMESLQFNALNSFGENVGLAGYSLFQSTISTMANNTLNLPNCPENTDFSFSVVSDSDFQQGLPGASYISTTFFPNQEPIPRVEYFPKVEFEGEYEINMFTPGCIDDGTCPERGIVNVTVWDPADNSILSTQLVFQNNNALKFTQLFSGTLDFSPLITLEFESGIKTDSTKTIVVADTVDLVLIEIDLLEIFEEFTETTTNITLNGLLQYQVSNFTGSSINETTSLNPNPIGFTELDKFSVDNFPSNSTLQAGSFEGTILLGSDLSSNISSIELNTDLSITSSDIFEAPGPLLGTTPFSEGLLLHGNLDPSISGSYIESFNGTFNAFPNINETINDVVNLTLSGSELIVINNEFIFNISSNSLISNSTALTLSVLAAGSTANDELLFSGAISTIPFAGLNSSIIFTGDESIEQLELPGDIVPYLGLFLNNSATVYAFEQDSKNMLFFSNEANNSLVFDNTITSFSFSGNQSLLSIGTNSFVSDSIFVILDLDNMTTIANETIGSDSVVNSIVNFGQNSTLLVGGDFSIPDSDCFGICLFDFIEKTWTSFANNTINGVITDMQFNDTSLFLSGLFDTPNNSSVNLASVNLTNFEITPIMSGEDTKLDAFAFETEKIITWNSTSLFVIENGTSSMVDLPDNSIINSISTIEEIGTSSSSSSSNSLSKRQEAGSPIDVLILNGQFPTDEFGLLQGMIFDFDTFTPYYILSNNLDITSGAAALSSGSTTFVNRDVSFLLNTPQVLVNVTTPSISTGTPTPTPSSSSLSDEEEDLIDRGFVVLIGLALALGTVAVLGIAGVILVSLFRSPDSDFQNFDPALKEGHVN